MSESFPVINISLPRPSTSAASSRRGLGPQKHCCLPNCDKFPAEGCRGECLLLSLYRTTTRAGSRWEHDSYSNNNKLKNSNQSCLLFALLVWFSFIASLCFLLLVFLFSCCCGLCRYSTELFSCFFLICPSFSLYSSLAVVVTISCHVLYCICVPGYCRGHWDRLMTMSAEPGVAPGRRPAALAAALSSMSPSFLIALLVLFFLFIWHVISFPSNPPALLYSFMLLVLLISLLFLLFPLPD